MPQAPFHLTLPDSRTTSAVFASPHSGSDYPPSMLARSVLDERSIRSSEDAFVDELFAAAPRSGAPLLAARFPRAWVDLNRAAEELDAALISGVAGASSNPRVAAGLGVIPRVVANGREIYGGKITMNEAERRIREGWKPYHDTLRRLLDESQEEFGEALLIDVHSMPHEAIDAIAHKRGRRPDIVLGDRFGAAAAPVFMDQVEAAFLDLGFRVARNAPFAGAYIAQRYGRPSANRHVIQVEIDRALYMDEGRIEKNDDFEAFREAMAEATALICEAGHRRTRLAAE